jgi:hypothetical protein
MNNQPTPEIIREAVYDLIVSETAAKQGVSQYSAATRLAALSTFIGAKEDAKKFAAIALERMKAGDKE